ncbi:MAG: hypothetical protein WBC98_13300, partial [Candidatus Zixiibacteriota bacterium]
GISDWARLSSDWPSTGYTSSPLPKGTKFLIEQDELSLVLKIASFDYLSISNFIARDFSGGFKAATGRDCSCNFGLPHSGD